MKTDQILNNINLLQKYVDEIKRIKFTRNFDSMSLSSQDFIDLSFNIGRIEGSLYSIRDAVSK